MAKELDPNKAKQLAFNGFSDTDIAKALGISRTTLYDKPNILDSIQEGRSELREKVSASIIESLDKTPGNQQMLVKRLGLFNPNINLSKPDNAKSALEALSTAIDLYSNGEINESQLRTLEATLNSYIKGYEITELEQRIQALEDANQ